MILKDKRIFIVEDNVQNRVVFQVALARHGASVEFERRGNDTLATLRRILPVDLIIMDLMLVENISGFDIYDQIRAQPEFATLPIVAVSAMESAVAIPKTRSKGFVGFISKPIDSANFAKQIAAILNGEQLWLARSVAAI